jgi:ABC-type phosphate transport system substrate-binding protein
LKATDCRTDAFAGTDVPYKHAQLEELNGTPGAGKELGGTACNISFTPPFQPSSKPWPSTEDTTEKVMSFPIGGSSVTIPFHFAATACGGAPPTELNFTPKEVSRILGGDAKEWSEKELATTNPSLAKCTNKITRVVRQDNSGTTNITKLYMIRVDNERTGAVCAPGKKWEEYNGSPNTVWPGKQSPTTEGECSEITTAENSGNPELLKKLAATEASVGYADLGDAATFQKENPTAGVNFGNVQNATGTEFVKPNAGKGANCDYRTLSLPGSSASDSVGLNPEENWASDNKEGNRGNATDLGSRYPICGLTWDLVYKGLDNGAVPNPISRLSADQRRTEYSFFSFVFSSAAQETLTGIEYAPLPTTWVGTIREGFQANF